MKARKNVFKVMSVFLTLLMLLSMMPSGFGAAVAAEVEKFSVTLPTGVQATVTMTDKNDAENVFSADTTAEKNVVEFSGLDDETTYTLSITGMAAYKNYTKDDIAATADGALGIAVDDLTAKDAQTIVADQKVELIFGGESKKINVTNAGAGSKALAFASKDKNIVTVDNDGNVTPVHAGETTITISKAADDNYLAATATVNVVVAPKAEGAITYTASEVQYEYASKDNLNKLTKADTAIGAVTYESSDKEVATVDGDGKVTIVGAPGQTATITAKFTANGGDYAGTEASYQITVVKANGGIYFENKTVSKTYGDAPATNNSLKGKKNETITGTLTYKSSHPDVVTVDGTTGEYTIVGAGEATITVTLTGDALYADGSTASYTINVIKQTNALSFDVNEEGIELTYGDAKENITEPALTLHNGSAVKPTVSFKSDDTSVVTVDADGNLTIIGAGKATITATAADNNDDYVNDSASYTVTVNKKEIMLSINLKIAFGQDDPVLTNKIRNQINAGLIKKEQAKSETENVDVLNEVSKCITYTYSGVVAAMTYRAAGTYEITLCAKEHDNYKFVTEDNSAIETEGTVVGELTVDAPFDAQAGEEYVVEGLIKVSENDFWSKDGVTISAQGRYSISESNHTDAEWADSLKYDKQCDKKDYTFYIRKDDDAISNAITLNFGIDQTAAQVVEKTGFVFAISGEKSTEKAINYLTFGIFFNEAVKVQVNTTDVTAGSENKFGSGVASAKLYANVKGDDTLTPEEIGSGNVESNTITFDLPVEKFEILKNIYVVLTDKVGNESADIYFDDTNCQQLIIDENKNISALNLLQLEQNDAEITITKADADYEKVVKTETTEETQAWYGDDVDFTIAVGDVGDKNSGIRSVLTTINDEPVSVETLANVKDVMVSNGLYDFTKLAAKTESLTFTVNTSQLEVLPVDGKYTIITTVVDNAGNVSEEEVVIYIDREAPQITNFTFAPADAEGIDGEELPAATVESYGYFFRTEAVVTVTAKDKCPSADIQKIHFYTVDIEKVQTDYEDTIEFITTTVEDGYSVVTASFEIPQGFKGQIYARATDNVEHTTIDTKDTDDTADDELLYFNPNGTAIEDAEKHKEHSAATIELVEDTEYIDKNGLPLYDAADDYPEGVPVKLYVKDTFSGIKNITWNVDAPYNATENDPKGNLTVESYLQGKVPAVGDVIGGEENGWTVEAVDYNLITEMSKVIYVTNNSNTIEVSLTMNDRAGNATTASALKFSIDNTDPVIDIVYDNEEADEQYTDFFKADRTATITITERNFNAKDVVFAITNTDKKIPGVDLTKAKTWKTTEDSIDPDMTTHVATIKYTADGDYTFDISYMDNADNKANKVDQHKFTIDKTLPVVNVVYDNNDALNGNYFKADRTATLTIVEHNFDTARVVIPGVATDDGAPSAFPAASEWKNTEKDTYTATIAYTADSKYTFDIEFHDKAGNSIADYAAEEFYVDKTAPVLEFSGVGDYSANNGVVAPVVSYSDTNFNIDAVSIVLNGAVNGNNLKYAGGYEDAKNGQVFTYADFKHERAYDDIYTLNATLTDMAGNVTTKSIVFSANRFGSIYDISKLENINGVFINEEKNLVFTETNVDALNRDDIKIKLIKNGTPFDLVEGEDKDYTVTVSGGNGQWSVYTYTINKALFADDGRYSLSIYSVDKAGNINENIDESKAAEISFGVDKTKPVVVPIDFESGKQYPEEGKDVSIEIKDNLVLDGVKIYLNDVEIDYTVNGETYTFNVPESKKKQDVKIVAVDAAGNEETVLVEQFLVTTDIFARWYNNTPLFVGSIVGVVVLALAITAFILFGKKKKEE